MTRKAVYAGSFDILTWGHIYVMKQGVALFDEVLVAIGNNPTKKNLFTADERKVILEECLTDRQVFTHNEWEKLIPLVFENQYLVDFAREQGADFYLRGLRSAKDYEFEAGMAQVNYNFTYPGEMVRPVWIPCDPKLAHIASSTVKALIGPKGWEKVIADYVPPTVYKRLLAKFA